MEDYFQFSVFDTTKQPLKIDKPIRLIELFAGYGSQHIGLERLGVDFESYRICEWAVKSIQAYKDLHFADDNTDYSQGMSKDEIVDYLFKKGISADYNKPMTREQINRMGEDKCRTVYNNIKATHNLVSVTNITADDLNIVDTDKYLYMLTYSFPCQDLSAAGLMNGMVEGSGTRSSLLWEVKRLLNECSELPQVLLMENVPQVHGKKNKEHFDKWIKFLESKGYSNYWKDLNAKGFGIPQNRNRTFMVSVLGNYTYEFPKEFPLELRLKDMLEDSVDEKFYLSDYQIKNLKAESTDALMYDKSMVGIEGKAREYNEIAPTITSREYKEPRTINESRLQEINCVQVGTLSGGKWDKMHDVSRRVYSEEGISPTIHTCGGGNTEPKVIGGIGEKKSNGGTQWYQQDRIYDNNVAISVTTVCNPYYRVDEPLAYDEQNGYIRKDGTVGTLTTDGSSPKHNNRVVEPVRLGYIPYPNSNKAHQSNTFYDENAISPTLDTCSGGNRQVKIQHNNLRIRKLTPKECFRLMGVKDEHFEKVAKNQSNSSLYHLAGDSIVVDVLYYIFKQMF